MQCSAVQQCIQLAALSAAAVGSWPEHPRRRRQKRKIPQISSRKLAAASQLFLPAAGSAEQRRGAATGPARYNRYNSD